MMYEDHDRDHPRDNGGNAGLQLLRLIALGSLLGASWHCVQRTHQRRYGSRSRPLPERLQTWEGEGGRPEPAEAGADAEVGPVAPGPL